MTQDARNDLLCLFLQPAAESEENIIMRFGFLSHPAVRYGILEFT